MLIAYDEIPFLGSYIYFGENVWSKIEVSNRLRAVLFENIGSMKIKGSKFDKTDDKLLIFDAMKKKKKKLIV